MSNISRDGVHPTGALHTIITEGTSTIGKLAANSGVDIGTVDITSIIPGTDATSLGKADDAVHSSGDTGIMALGVRNDTLATLVGTDGDYTPLQVNANGAIYATSASIVDSNNSSTTNLTTATSLIFTGSWTNVLEYSGISVSANGTASGTVSGTLQMQFSHDGSTVHRNISTNNTDVTNIPSRTLGVTANYFRVIYTSNSDLTSFDLQTILHTQQVQQVSKINQTLQGTEDVTNVRSIITGKTHGGDYKNVPVDIGGHLECSIQEPRLPFGSISCESLTPIFQTDAVYGLNPNTLNTTIGHSTDGSTSATNTVSNSLFKSATGTTANSFASIESRRRLRYRSGQGIIGRFTALFSTPQASSRLIAGFGTEESGFYFGYNGTTFGILHATDGIREIQTLEITTASSATNDIQITLPSTSVAQVFTVSGITNASGSKQLTAYQISKGTFTGWKAEQRGVYVVFLRDKVGVLTGTAAIAQSGAGTPVAGSYVETLTGVASTDVWVAQSSWNGDVCDGTGVSGFNLDHTKGNLYQIDLAWLGFGPIRFRIMTPNADNNNLNWTTVHTFINSNARTTPHTSNPSFPFIMSAISTGSTTDVWVKCASFGGFIEGMTKYSGPRSSFSDISQAVSTGSYFTLFSIRNDYIYGNTGITERANQSIVVILSFGGAHDDSTPVIFYLLRNATLVGTPNWIKWSVGSCIYTETAATSATITNNGQIIQAIPVGQTGTVIIPMEDTTTLQPGETLTVAATAVTGTSTYSIATLNIREDQ
jgi:hypothetical protein